MHFSTINYNCCFFVQFNTGDNMKVRLGYVALSKAMENVTSSSTTSYTNYEKAGFPVEKLAGIVEKNIAALKEIITYNVKNNIHFYRVTSNLIPLATHEKVKYDYLTPFRNKYHEIAQIVKESNMRIDMHPDQYAVLNSTNQEVVKNTFKILNYHYEVLSTLEVENKIIVMHVGSSVFGKKPSITRFINNFNKLPEKIRKSIIIENDDKTFTVKDTLYLCNKINVPMVLDYHHHMCNNNGENIEQYLEEIFSTWKNINPKVHFSSPKNHTKKDFRSHHDYVDAKEFINFIEKIKKLDYDVDIMIEAKAKDDALFRLTRQLRYLTNYKFIDETTFIP